MQYEVRNCIHDEDEEKVFYTLRKLKSTFVSSNNPRSLLEIVDKASKACIKLQVREVERSSWPFQPDPRNLKAKQRVSLELHLCFTALSDFDFH
ncbi:hypothetical protein DHL47_12480 [Streptococcus panodentis]|uniref:Uncharacterized protein n=1 Tax=Streptococcus panodentis TaxID=1581472 RepID=A0ABS5AZX6_9STRE|nr:hypothetical protein [Streptococcus panodentis]